MALSNREEIEKLLELKKKLLAELEATDKRLRELIQT
jgi:flagellar biosynthesis/type III secretory pathway chaperone